MPRFFSAKTAAAADWGLRVKKDGLTQMPRRNAEIAKALSTVQKNARV